AELGDLGEQVLHPDRAIEQAVLGMEVEMGEPGHEGRTDLSHPSDTPERRRQLNQIHATSPSNSRCVAAPSEQRVRRRTLAGSRVLLRQACCRSRTLRSRLCRKRGVVRVLARRRFHSDRTAYFCCGLAAFNYVFVNTSRLSTGQTATNCCKF